MKKILLFILVLCGACYWGYLQGNDINKTTIHENKQTHAASALPSSDWLDTVLAAPKKIISGFSSEESPAGTLEITKEETAPEKESVSFDTVLHKLYVLRHFKPALESRIDRQSFCPADKIPPLLKEAVVATEDRRFYDHGAVDIISIGRAFITNQIAGKTVEGGSTLAQQTVKNIFLSQDRTLERKAEELILATLLEKNYTKDEILEIYLNTIYYGHGAYGLTEASHTYFGIEPEKLDLSQCAMLAGLPQAPSAYDPLDHPEEGARRMTTVLALMAQEGYITPTEAASAAAELWLK